MSIVQKALLTDVESAMDLTFVNSYPVVTGAVPQGSCEMCDVESAMDLTFTNSYPVVTGAVPQGSCEMCDVESAMDLTFTVRDLTTEDNSVFENQDVIFAPFAINLGAASDIGDTRFFENQDVIFAPFLYTEMYALNFSAVLQENQDVIFAPFNHNNAGIANNTGAMCDVESAMDLTFIPSSEIPIIWVDGQNMTDTQDVPTFETAITYVTPTTWTSTEALDGMAISCLRPGFDFDINLDYIASFMDRSNPAHYIEQYKDSTKLNAIALAFLPQFSQLEQSALDMLAYGYLSTAFGTSLDEIGRIFGIVRGSLNDSEYRIAIAQKSANRGLITPNDIMTVLRDFYGVEAIKFVSGVDGHIVFESYPVLVPEDVYPLIGAGISVEFREFSFTALYGEDDFAIVNEFGDYIYVQG